MRVNYEIERYCQHCGSCCSLSDIRCPDCNRPTRGTSHDRLRVPVKRIGGD